MWYLPKNYGNFYDVATVLLWFSVSNILNQDTQSCVVRPSSDAQDTVCYLLESTFSSNEDNLPVMKQCTKLMLIHK